MKAEATHRTFHMVFFFSVNCLLIISSSDCISPLQFFHLLLPLSFFLAVVKWTNERVAIKLAGATVHAKTDKRSKVAFNYHKGWLPLTVAELRIYFAIILLSRTTNLSWHQIWSKNASTRFLFCQ